MNSKFLKNHFLTTIIFSTILLLSGACNSHHPEIKNKPSLYLLVLGTAQDAGYPQTGCNKQCCQKYYSGKIKKQFSTSLAVVDEINNKIILFDCTPDFREQWQAIQTETQLKNKNYPDAIFLTHAHIGHYTGLMQLGREVMNSTNVPVYAMPRMTQYLTNNGPWSQLVSLDNITLNKLQADSTINLTSIQVTPILVPHRDEYSETVGFIIKSANKKILFIPDINKWTLWNYSIVDEIKKVDIAFIDGTFYKDGELSNRNMKDIPHPFVEESIKLFSQLNLKERHKIYFIHFNHTNPLIWDKHAQQELNSQGFNFAVQEMKVEL